METSMSNTHVSGSVTQTRLASIARNPLVYAFIILGAIVTEKIGLSYDNPYAQSFACSNAYYMSDEPLKTPACVKIIERLRHQLG
jgi:hypothetical protein